MVIFDSYVSLPEGKISMIKRDGMMFVMIMMEMMERMALMMIIIIIRKIGKIRKELKRSEKIWKDNI